MFDSGKYWDERYMRGGNSGAGSYNKLAKFKSDVINGFIERNKIKSIVDYGVGDGNQLKLINTEKLVYTGVDVSGFIISKCKQEFKDDKSKKFIQVDDIDDELKAELVLSCDVLYHLIEDDVYSDYMKNLFSMSRQYVIIYANDKDINHAIHVKFRKFSKYIESNLPQWYLIKHIPNKYPQLKLGKDNDNTSPSDFYIYKKDDEFLSITNYWKGYIETHLMKIVKGFNVNLDGNMYSAHHSFDDTNSHLSNKRFNIYNVLKKTKPKTILEIGFNAGFSCLLMKLVVPVANITCVDLNQHLYVMPCFNKISSDFSGLRMIPGSSYDIGLPQLIKENKKFDFIHIDGDHRLEGARKDMELCLKLCHEETIILFDDANLKHLDDLCSKYVINRELKDYNFEMYLNNQKYKHRFLQVEKTHSAFTRPMLICGFPHSGTSILKSIIGHIDDVDEIIRETDYIAADRLNNSKHKFVLAKTPYLEDKIFTEKYDKYIKIVIARNPCYTYSSLNKRYNYKIPDRLNIENAYVNFLEKVDYLIDKKEKNTYVVFYEDLFDNNFQKLKEILDTIGLKYTEQIFDNSKYRNYITNDKNIPKSPPLRNDHDSFRTYQINQPLKNLNDNEMIDLTERQRNLIKSHPLINRYFDTSVLSTSRSSSGLRSRLPIYISMTSIFRKQGHLFKTLQSITKQTRKADKVFIFLSEDPYILDDGFKDRKITNPELLKFIDDNSFIDVKWVKNTGSYRKLLPLLKDKWDEDCIIITIDDDNIYDTNLIENLVRDYYEQRCVIGYRGFTPLFDEIEDFEYSKHDKLQNLSLYNFLTGKGGILYKPEFFHKTKNLVFNHEIYLNECHIQDDIWFYIVRILNNKYCYISNKKWDIRDLPNQGLFLNFNRHNNTNTVSFRRALKRIKELGYKF
jgi:predicted O-methyltransferase YrrM